MKIRVLTLLTLFSFSVSISIQACSTSETQLPVPESHPQQLKLALHELLDLAKNGDEERLRTKLEKTLPTLNITQSLLRDTPQNKGLGKRFSMEIRQDALKELPVILITAYKRGLHEVKITRVSPQAGSTNSPGDLALLEQLKDRQGLYTVHLLREGESKGLRLNAWLHLKGSGWISLLKLGELIESRNEQ